MKNISISKKVPTFKFTNRLLITTMKKNIVITGGASGIGRCLVEYFATKGNNVCFIDQNRERTEKLILNMQEKNIQLTGYIGDVAEKEVLENFAQKVLQKHPEGIHCLINNACLTLGGILDDCSYDQFLYVQRVGVVAPYMLTLLFKNHFCGLGSIINVSSTRAFQSQPNTESYTAAKGGITALTHALAVSLKGIARVNSIAPGWIDTSEYQTSSDCTENYSSADKTQHPSLRIGHPLDVARLIEFLCDDRNTFINGENITIDGGMSRLMIYHNDYGWFYQE